MVIPELGQLIEVGILGVFLRFSESQMPSSVLFWLPKNALQLNKYLHMQKIGKNFKSSLDDTCQQIAV